MKRTLCIALLLLLALSACGNQPSPEPGPETFTITPTTTEALTTEPPTTEPPPPTTMLQNPIRSIGDSSELSGELVESFPLLKEPAKDYMEVQNRYLEMYERGVIWGGELEAISLNAMLYDLDGDFTPELLISIAFGYRRGMWQVYTMYNGKTRWIGSFWGGAFYSHSEGGIYIGWQAHDHESWTRLTKKGNRLVEKELFGRYLVEQEPFEPEGVPLYPYVKELRIR